jgi:Ner family transcriptional regulator
MVKSQSIKKARLDWHPADVKAALEKAGWSVTRLAKSHGLTHGVVSRALRYPYRRGEMIVADALGLDPREIWPSRYLPDGEHVMEKRKREHRRTLVLHRWQKRNLKDTTASSGCNVNVEDGE